MTEELIDENKNNIRSRRASTAARSRGEHEHEQEVSPTRRLILLPGGHQRMSFYIRNRNMSEKYFEIGKWYYLRECISKHCSPLKMRIRVREILKSENDITSRRASVNVYSAQGTGTRAENISRFENDIIFGCLSAITANTNMRFWISKSLHSLPLRNRCRIHILVVCKSVSTISRNLWVELTCVPDGYSSAFNRQMFLLC